MTKEEVIKELQKHKTEAELATKKFMKQDNYAMYLINLGGWIGVDKVLKLIEQIEES